MRVIDTIRKSAVAVAPDRSVSEAAAVMEAAGVGAVAVVDGDELVGIVTDRDLVVRALARRLSLEARVDAVMSTALVTIDAAADVHDAFALFRTHALRRLPVIRDGRFVGMVTADDMLIDLAADLADLARPITAEVVFGHHDPAVPATT